MSLNYGQLKVLNNERFGDPLDRGYAQMSVSQFTQNIKVVDRDANLTRLPSVDVINGTVEADYYALTEEQKTRFWQLFPVEQFGSHDFQSVIYRDLLGDSSSSMANLRAMRKTKISRERELGLPPVEERDVYRAEETFGAEVTSTEVK